jgi:hypothetical protein
VLETTHRPPVSAGHRLRIVVGGYLGLMPAGGVTWDYVQYPVGLAMLGHDVFYIEDTRLWPVYQTDNDEGANCSANVAHVAAVMDDFGLGDRWAYRDEVSGRCFGLSETAVREICRTADLLINVSCSTFPRDEYRSIPVRLLVDSDPMFTQIQYTSQAAFTPGHSGMREIVDGHTHHFTFGLNIGASDCRIPVVGVSWLPTRQPICLQYWPRTALPPAANGAYTTVMNWAAGRPLAYEGEIWGQKDVEFRRLLALPKIVPDIPLAVAVGQTDGGADPFPAEIARRQGWRVLDPSVCAPDWRSYRAFIERSSGELSVAKETYVKAHTGWFSCRSACYLAMGRPVITQETGWSRHLPSGCGLLAFDDVPSAADALRRVAADPATHARAARAIAEEHFASDRVLNDMLAQVGV